MKLDLKSKLISVEELKEYGFELCTNQSVSYVDLPFSYFLDKAKKGEKEEIIIRENFKKTHNYSGKNYINYINDEKQLKKEIAKDIFAQTKERFSTIVENKRVFLETYHKRSTLEKLFDFITMHSLKIQKSLAKIDQELELSKELTFEMIEKVIDVKVNRIPENVMFNVPNDFKELLNIKKLYLSSNQRPNSGIFEYNIKEIRVDCHYSYNDKTSVDFYILADVDFSSKDREYNTERNIYLNKSKNEDYFYLSDNFVGHKVFSSLDRAYIQYEKYLKSEMIKLKEDYEKLSKK